MRPIGIAGISGAAFLALLLWCVLVLAAQIEARVKANAEAALAAAGAAGISVQAYGRGITLTGTVADDAARAAALAAAAAAAGVASVEDQLTAGAAPASAAAAPAYGVTLTWSAGRLVLAGQVETGEARGIIAAFAKNAFSGAIVDDQLVAQRGAPGADWPTAVRVGVAALRPLAEGVFTLSVQGAHLTGIARDEAQREGAISVLGALPSDFPATHEIALASERAPLPMPYRFDAAREGKVIALSGALGSESVQRALIQELKRDWPGAELTDQTVIDPLMPDGSFPDAVAAALGAMKSLKAANLSISGRSIVLDGLAAGTAERDTALAALLAAPFAYALSGEIGVAGEGVRTPVKREGGAGLACQSALDAALARVPALFEPGAATLLASASLDGLAEAIKSCGALRLQILAHVAAAASTAAAQELTQRRAEALRTALNARGLAPDQLAAFGFGMARPIAPMGDARNERMEISVRP